MFLSNYVAIAGRNLTVDNLKQKLELYIIDTENQLRKDLISLCEVLKTILIYKPSEKTLPLFIINIGETNAFFERDQSKSLQELLRTHASSLFNSIASSGGCIQEILLPLLSSEHAQEVILDLANQNQE
ncbi:11139_t:CDS:2, partial [Entrophospora sp. SA101]